ncbi:MAG TPA: hypothetical protein DHV14_10695 [Micrococcales bacterium]|nr:hypothetical protein [Micrococcales bacterium]
MLGSICFTSLGLLVAARLRAEAVLAVANLLWLAMAAIGGLVLPADGDTRFAVPLASWLPSGALGDAMRAALVDGALAEVALVVLAAWTVACLTAAARWFRPTE